MKRFVIALAAIGLLGFAVNTASADHCRTYRPSYSTYRVPSYSYSYSRGYQPTYGYRHNYGHSYGHGYGHGYGHTSRYAPHYGHHHSYYRGYNSSGVGIHGRNFSLHFGF